MTSGCADVAWFGPDGVALVVYGPCIVEADLPQGASIFQLVAVVTEAALDGSRA